MGDFLHVALPWIFSLLGGVIFYVCAKHPIGWLIGVVQMIILIPIAILENETGFYSQSVIYSAVFLWNFFYEMKEHKKPEHEKPRCTGCGNVLKVVRAG